MAIQSQAVRGGSRRRGFAQTEAMNAQLPYLNDIIRAENEKKMRAEDVAFREKDLQFQIKSQKEQMKQQEAAQRTNMGLQAAQLGLNLSSNPATGGKTLNSILPSGKGILPEGMNIGNTLGAGLVGLGLGGMVKGKGKKIGIGGIGGALTGLIGAGAGQGLTGAITGGVSGGLGGLLSGLL